jgi:hypothetical protein
MGRAKQADKPAQDANVLERIAEAVEKLADEIEALRKIIDRLQDDFAWALNNDSLRCGRSHCESVIPMHITSMPRDPLAPDWPERINRFRPENLPDLDDDEDGVELKAVQRDLFS